MKSAIQILQEFKEKAQQYYLEDYKYNQNLPDEILSEIVEVHMLQSPKGILQELLDRTFRENIEAIYQTRLMEYNQAYPKDPGKKEQIEKDYEAALARLQGNEQEQRDALNEFASFFYGNFQEYLEEWTQIEEIDIQIGDRINKRFSPKTVNRHTPSDLPGYLSPQMKVHKPNIFKISNPPRNGLKLLLNFLSGPIPEKIGIEEIKIGRNIRSKPYAIRPSCISSWDLVPFLALKNSLQGSSHIQTEAGIYLLGLSGGIAAEISFCRKPYFFEGSSFKILRKANREASTRMLNLYHFKNYNRGDIQINVPYGYLFILDEFMADVSFVAAPILFS